VSGQARTPGELNLRELARWTWRQVTSMRTALVLLLLLALAAIPGSVIPQEDIDSLKVSRWKDAHPRLTPIWEKLDLFSVYTSVWFSAIYILLLLSLVGCIVPRVLVYARALRAAPPRAPRNLTRLPQHATYETDESPEAVLERAAVVLRKKRFRVVAGDDAVSAERGYLREAGNLVFHLALLVVLVGFAMGGLFGYKGGVILIQGTGFSNNLTQYDDFAPGSLFDPSDMEDFSFRVKDFDVEWLTEGKAAGQAREFVAHLDYRETLDGETKDYDLRVNHPLTIGGSDIFLIGHGYAPVITIRDGNGDVALSGPTIFLPEDQTFRSFGVIKAADARPDQIGLEGSFFPAYNDRDAAGNLIMPHSLWGDITNPLSDSVVSMHLYTGDLGLDDGRPSSVYVLDKERATAVTKDNGQPVRLDLRPGETVKLPDGMGSVTFEGIERWQKIQISRTPGKFLALGGVVAALIGLLGSLFIRPRRAWVRARRLDDATTLVEIARLDRSAGGDPDAHARELAEIVEGLGGAPREHAQKEKS
jgi:cytochrome c biogenesis protein